MIKQGVRVLGIAESFIKHKEPHGVLAGVVMRGDMHIDGFGFTTTTVGGNDATDKIIELFNTLNRRDIRFILISGCIISWFNVINVHRVAEETERPTICVSYRPSEGIEKYLKEYFPNDWKWRLELIQKEKRERIFLNNGFDIYIVRAGIEKRDARVLLSKFVKFGRIPEPIRVSRILAHSLLMAIRSSALDPLSK